MPSPAFQRFNEVMLRADTIMGVHSSGLDRGEIQALFGAVFATQVAAWNAYVVAVVRAFYIEIANSASPTFHAMHTISSSHAEKDLDRFNTPNSEKTRELLVVCTGYDPWPDWAWPRSGVTALAARLRLNEILKVRHSFAHGFAMPACAWNVDASGRTRLTRAVLKWNRAFLFRIATKTDVGLKTHIRGIYGRAAGW
jgi:hypothetical protein